jgi:hypothetical protein
MSEPNHPGINSCVTIVIVIGIFLCLLIIIGLGVVLLGANISGL